MTRLVATCLALAFILSACDSVFFDQEPANNPESTFEELWTTFSEKYAVFEQRNVDWDAQYRQFRHVVTEATTDAELHDILTGMMEPLDDGHVSLFAPNEPFWNGHREFRQPTASGAFSGDLLLNGYLGGVFQNYNDQIYYGRVHPEVGYMFISHFSGEELTVIDDILAGLQGVSGVIIDLRRNGGGDFGNALVLISRFADQKRLAFSAIPKDGPGRNDFADPVDYFVEPGGSSQFDGRVVVLTDRYTLSAGESAVLFLRVLPNVTVIGEATSGAMGERIEKELPNGWIYSITGQRIVAADGNNYEGPGVPPDIQASNTSAQISEGVDHILDLAIEKILN